MPPRRLQATLLAVVLGATAGCEQGSAASRDEEPLVFAPAIDAVTNEKNVDSVADETEIGSATDEPQEAPDPDDPRQALLIGCSRYDHLPESAQLRGPVNDIVMMKELLTGHFRFPAGNVTILSERRASGAFRPLRANIERELKSMAERARPGSKVVVYFSGHGAQQPNDDPDDPDDPEPDGLDEILCPADTSPDFDEEKLRVPNAISDDELRGWLGAIQKRGAAVWVIIDACHSGTAIRGTEVYRQVPPEMLVPRDVLQKAALKARASRGVSTDSSPFDFDEQVGGIVAIYAAQPHEPTIELPLPLDSDDRQWRGLLTYNLVKVLTASAEPVTYTELVQRIHQEYVTSLGRLGPVPLVEGNDRNREVLGTTEWPERSRLLLQAGKDGKFKINAGRLHGLTAGTILAVFPPAGNEAGQQPLGYVRVAKAGTLHSFVEPQAFNDLDAPRQLPDGARCHIVRREFGDLRLRVAVDPSAEEQGPVAALRERLAAGASREGAIYEVVDDVARAQWLVRALGGDRVVLLPAEGWARAPGAESAPLFGPAPIDEKLDDWLSERLGRVARAVNLLKVAGEMSGERRQGLLSALFGKESTDLRVELRDLKSADDDEGKPLEWSRGGLQLAEGAVVALRLLNRSPHAVDFTVLFIDSGYGIEPVFPSPKTVVDNRLAPGASFTVGPLAIDADSVGLEHLIVIALKSEGQPVDFTWLAQASLEQARAAGSQRGGLEGNNPLGQLLGQALFGARQTRGLKAAAATTSVAVQAVSWQTVPRSAQP